jgi:hypothetical protein
MNPNDPNVGLIEVAAAALTEFLDRVVFVGGCAVGLLITDAARPPVRATQDVDLIVEIGSRAEYYKLSDRLRAAGLSEDWPASTISFGRDEHFFRVFALHNGHSH